MSDMTADKDKTRRIPGGAGFDWFSLFAALISIFIAALIIYPLGKVMIDVFFDGWAVNMEPFRQLAAEHNLGGLLLNTVIAVGSATTIAVVIGGAFAWLNERTDIDLAFLGEILPIIPLLVPPIAGAIGWVLLAAPSAGFFNDWVRSGLAIIGFTDVGKILNIFSWPGLIFVYAIYLLPHVYLTVAAGLRNLDPSLEEAARVSGAGPWATLRMVTLPAVMPSVLSGGILALITGFSLFSIPLIIGGQGQIDILSVRIVHSITAAYPPKIGVALLLGLVVVAVIGSSWMLQRRILKSGNFATIGGRGMRASRVKLGIFRWPARIFMLFYLFFTSILPLIALGIVSLQPYWTSAIDVSKLSLKHYFRLFGGHAFAREGLQNSIVLGIAGATVGMLVAAIVTYYVDRNRQRPFASFVDSTTKLPASVSHLIIGIAFVISFAGAPFYLNGTTTILFLAYIVLYTPQATVTAGSALAQVGRQLTEASLVSGASQGTTFYRVTLPLMIPGLTAGWTVLFVLIAGDITASSMLAGNRNPVSGFVILELWTNGSFPPLAGFAVVVSLLMGSVALVSLWISKRTTRVEFGHQNIYMHDLPAVAPANTR